MSPFLSDPPPTTLPEPWAYTLAAPFVDTEDPERVTLWCLKEGEGWFAVVDHTVIRPLNELETQQADIQAGRRQPITVNVADLDLEPFIMGEADDDTPEPPTPGNVLRFADLVKRMG